MLDTLNGYVRCSMAEAGIPRWTLSIDQSGEVTLAVTDTVFTVRWMLSEGDAGLVEARGYVEWFVAQVRADRLKPSVKVTMHVEDRASGSIRAAGDAAAALSRRRRA